MLITSSFACGISTPEYIKGSAKDINLTLDEMINLGLASDNYSVGADGLYKMTLFGWLIVKAENCDNLESFSYRYFVPIHFFIFKGEGTGVSVTIYKDSDSAKKCFNKIKELYTQSKQFMPTETLVGDDSGKISYQLYFVKDNLIGRILTSCDTCATSIAEKLIEKISEP